MATENSNAQTILTDLINYLKGLDPDISTEEGDPIRLILQAVSQELAQAQFTSLASDNFLDLIQKSGADLTAFGAFFGILRQAGTPSTVTIEFYSNSPLTTTFNIQAGTQVTDLSGLHTFQTTQAVDFVAGTSSISIPAQSQNIGTSQNVPAYSLTNLPTSLTQVGIYCQNTEPATGGTDEESDKHYRTRIQNTFLKNHIGTPASYENLLLSLDNATRGKCVTAISTFAEQNEIVPLKTAFGGGDGFVSTITDASYVYPNSSYLIKNALQANQTDFIEGVQYEFDSSTMPTVPIFQVSSQDLSNILEGYSGSSLDAIGASLGLSRYQGSATSGTLLIQTTTPFSVSFQVPAGSQFSYFDSSNSTQYILSLSTATNLPGNSTSSQLVPYSFENLGSVEMETGTEVKAYGSTSDNIYGTIQTINQGSLAWTDDQYRSELLSLYASQTALQEGDLVYSQFRYCAACSRNTPPTICNKLDLFTDASTLSETMELGLCNFLKITADNQKDFVKIDGTFPAIGSSVQILETPCVEGLASDFSVNGTAYEGEFVKDNSLFRNSDRAKNAILFDSGTTLPATASSYSVSLIVNEAISNAQNAVYQASSLGMDVLAHAGRQAFLTINLVIIPLLGTPAQTLQSFCNTQLSSYLASVEFGSQVILSDLVNSLFDTGTGGASYIKACRLAKAEDVKAPTIDGNSLNLGIQVSQEYGSDISGLYTGDFWLPQDMYPVLKTVNIAIEAANTYVNSFAGAGSSTSSNGQAQQNTADWFNNPNFYVA